jgi:hypothetical protein
MVAGAAVAIAAIAGIAIILEWFPFGQAGDTPGTLVAPGPGTAPPESLSPGETIVPPAKP